MGITIQAISKYFKKLAKEGLLEAGSGRADYRLSPKAMGKLHDDLKSLEHYVTSVKSEMKIELPRPRDINDPRVGEYAVRIAGQLESTREKEPEYQI